MILPLSDLKLGQSATVVWLASDPKIKQRLLDLGFSPKEKLSYTLKASEKGMRAYLVRDALIALRKNQAQTIFVEVQ